MVGVNIDEGAVKSDRSLIERDQCANAEGVCLGNGNSDRFTILLVKSSAGPTKKSVKVIAAGNAGFDIKSRFVSVFCDFDECDKEIQHAITQLLNVSVLISRAFVPVNRNALMDDVAVEVFLFA